MENLLETIRVAAQSDATDEAKHQGVLACRTILTALDAKLGESLIAPNAQATPTAPAPAPAAWPAGAPAQVAQIVGALRGMQPEQLLDLAIARLRAALPAESAAPTVAPVRFQMIPIAPLAATVSTKRRGS